MAEDPVEGQSEEESRPDWLPEKFKSEEAFAESYTQLERRLTEEANQRAAYESGYAELAAEVEQLRASQTQPDPETAQNWLEEQYNNDPIRTTASIAAQAARNELAQFQQQFQQQQNPYQDGQYKTAAALADYELTRLEPEWETRRDEVSALIQQNPHFVPEQHLSDPIALREDLLKVFNLARSNDLAQRVEVAEQRAAELEHMKLNAQTMTGSMGRPMAPDAAKAEWEAIRNAKPGGYS